MTEHCRLLNGLELLHLTERINCFYTRGFKIVNISGYHTEIMPPAPISVKIPRFLLDTTRNSPSIATDTQWNL